jgi:hypothetical protein
MSPESAQHRPNPRTDPTSVNDILNPTIDYDSLSPDMREVPADQENYDYRLALCGLESRIDQLDEDPSIWRLDTSADITKNPRLAEFPFIPRKNETDLNRKAVVRIVDEPGKPRVYEVDYSRTRLRGNVHGRERLTWQRGAEAVTTETPELKRMQRMPHEATTQELRNMRAFLHQNISQPNGVPITFESRKVDPAEIARQGRVERAAVWIARKVFRQMTVVSLK